MRFYIKTLYWPPIQINVSKDVGIRLIKWEIERKKGIPSGEQRYVYAGKVLIYQRLISGYEIVEV